MKSGRVRIVATLLLLPTITFQLVPLSLSDPVSSVFLSYGVYRPWFLAFSIRRARAASPTTRRSGFIYMELCQNQEGDYAEV